jgi:predicted membrane-bound dolichyl-phosphate-mannose-protein mannosyltransferase
LAASLYLFNPAVFVNSAMWGQVDGITGFFALASVFFAQSIPAISIFTLGFGALMKAPAGFVAPIVGLLWLRTHGWKRAAMYSLLTAALFVVGFVPFATGKPLFPFIIQRIAAFAGQYKYTSENAFNFWALLLGLWKPDAGWPQVTGIVLTVIISLLALWFWWKAEKNNLPHAYPMRYLAAAIIMLGSFFFLTRMHERHLLPGLAPLPIAAAAFPVLWIPYAIFSPVYLASLRFSYVWVTQQFKWIFPDWVVRVLSAVNVAAFSILIFVLVKPAERLSAWVMEKFVLFKEKFKTIQLARSELVETYWYLFLGFILAFALLSRLYMIGSPSTYYFDEVYHSFTAQGYLNKNPDAWVWYSHPPKGFAYDWVQPPLAKLLMAGTMSVFGENVIGWRMAGLLLGVGAVLFVYLIGAYLFKNKTLAVLAAAIFSLDGLPLTLSRIGTNDSTFLFFTLGTVYFFLRDKYWWSALFLGFAASTKLSVIWIPPTLAILFFLLRKQWTWRLAWFVIIPPVVYMITFIPFFTLGHTWPQFIELHRQMIYYHSHLQATHPFQSSAWTWPFMLKPIWFYTHSENSLISNIYAHGNPAVFWIGFVTVIVALIVALLLMNRELLALLAMYFGLFAPWIFSPRIMFLYHYLPSVPFLSLLLAWVLMSNRHWKKASLLFLLIALILFIFLYPRWIAIPITPSFNSLYAWLPS